MIHVVAIIKTKPGKRDTVLEAFVNNMPAVHDERGCIEYRPVIDANNAVPFQTEIGPDTFIVIEKWQTIADLSAHAKSAHMADYADRVKALIADRAVHVLEDIIDR